MAHQFVDFSSLSPCSSGETTWDKKKRKHEPTKKARIYPRIVS